MTASEVLDRRVRPWPGPFVHVGRRTVPAYRLFALLGLVLGSVVFAAAARLTGTAWSSVVAVTAVSLVTSLGVVALRVLVRAGDLVWSEHEAAVLVVALAVGLSSGHPLALLDAVALGLLVLLACGRMGCLLAGCCYGRPVGPRPTARCYTDAHARLGFPTQLVSCPLQPIQAGEAIWATGAFVTGATMLVAGSPPGAALVAALGLRTAGRVLFQQLRGDGPLPYGGLVAPEWWALGWAGLMVGATVTSGLPLGWWTAAPVGTLAVLGVVVARRTIGQDRPVSD